MNHAQAVGVFGAGYVGLLQAAGLAELGFSVFLYEPQQEKRAQLSEGQVPFFEEGLAQMLRAALESKRLIVCDSEAQLLSSCDLAFVCVGTPSLINGSADLCYVHAVCDAVGTGWKEKQESVLILKSTVPVGTAASCRKRLPKNIHVVNNPEFLREGTAVWDFRNPDRIVLGGDNAQAVAKVSKLYAHFSNKGVPVLEMSSESAELCKYAGNAFLALKISYANEIARLCKSYGASYAEVLKGFGTDRRIGNQFLSPGPGFGGSCFPKDVRALESLASQVDLDLRLPTATLAVNAEQRKHVVNLVCHEKVPKRVGVLGAAFKAGTDDIRESSTLEVVEGLLGRGVEQVLVHDPQAKLPFLKWLESKAFRTKVVWFDDAPALIRQCEVVAVLTEWPEYKKLVDDIKMASPKLRRVVDARAMFLDESRNFVAGTNPLEYESLV